MSYTRKYSTDIPEINEKIYNFLKGKNIPWRIENEVRPLRGSGIAGTMSVPTGWATLTVGTSDPKLCEELNDLSATIRLTFISKKPLTTASF